ncbi:MAG: autotransporter assembly complex protein TamA [Desulfofustis sp.]|nr:autotransporter assembly complex protein TamA [Desulfofustis sp.]
MSAPWAAWSTENLTITVEGVDEELQKNILARLRINIYSQEEELSTSEILRLHQLSETDIRSALAPFGYYSPTITTSLNETESGWSAYYTVDPGRPVIVGMVSLSVTGQGMEAFEFAGMERIALKEGDVLDQRVYEQEKKRIIREAISQGYLEASFRRNEILVNRKEFTADIILDLEPGPRYFFGEFRSQQDIIDDDLFRRFIEFDSNDYFSAKRLQELQRDLYRSDYFSSVILEADTANPVDFHVPVDIELEPLTAYNRYSFGLGYSTDTLAYVRVEWLNRLLNKKGHNLFSSLMVGERERYALLNYLIPIVDPRYNTFVGSGQWRQETWEDTDTELYSLGALYEYSTPRHYYGVSLKAQNEKYTVGDTRGISELLMPGIKWSWALADDIINTRHGIRASVDVTGASDAVLSDATFIKVRAEGKAIITPLEHWRVIGRGSVGTTVVDSIDDIPPSIRFYAGGQQSVRGYQYRSLGPEDSSGTVIGGKFLLTGGIECERQLSENWRAMIFYDAGNAMDDLSVDLAHGIGAGIGLRLPFGQVKLEGAYPLNDLGDSQYVYLSVGADL